MRVLVSWALARPAHVPIVPHKSIVLRCRGDKCDGGVGGPAPAARQAGARKRLSPLGALVRTFWPGSLGAVHRPSRCLRCCCCPRCPRCCRPPCLTTSPTPPAPLTPPPQAPRPAGPACAAAGRQVLRHRHRKGGQRKQKVNGSNCARRLLCWAIYMSACTDL